MYFMVFCLFPNLLSRSLILAFTAISILMLLHVVSILYVFAYTCLENFMLNLYINVIFAMLIIFYWHLNCSEIVAFHNKECCKIVPPGTPQHSCWTVHLEHRFSVSWMDMTRLHPERGKSALARPRISGEKKSPNLHSCSMMAHSVLISLTDIGLVVRFTTPHSMCVIFGCFCYFVFHNFILEKKNSFFEGVTSS